MGEILMAVWQEFMEELGGENPDLPASAGPLASQLTDWYLQKLLSIFLEYLDLLNILNGRNSIKNVEFFYFLDIRMNIQTYLVKNIMTEKEVPICSVWWLINSMSVPQLCCTHSKIEPKIPDVQKQFFRHLWLPWK